MQTQIGKLEDLKRKKGIDAFLMTSPAAIKYFSGYFFYFEHGPSPFHLMPAALVMAPGDHNSLLIADNEIGQAQGIYSDISFKPYLSYTYNGALDPAREFLLQLSAIIKVQQLENTCIGIEANTFPAVIENYLKTTFPRIRLKDIGREIYGLRAIKTREEIDMIRASAALCDTGQTAVVSLAKPGMTELELFNLVRTEIETAAGTRIPLMADFVGGRATASGGGLPGNKIIQSGELILSDLTPCLNGYWGDSCSTIAIDEPTVAQKKTFALVHESLYIGIDAIRPGIQALELDGLMRKHTGGYPHHTGHGVGVEYHEGPRIVPHNRTKLVPGMVIALEPAIYTEDYGIRLEHLVVVTEDGCEMLTRFEHQLIK